jgi:hypothetical protein
MKTLKGDLMRQNTASGRYQDVISFIETENDDRWECLVSMDSNFFKSWEILMLVLKVFMIPVIGGSFATRNMFLISTKR